MIRRRNGAIEDVAQTNEKGFKKSIEQGRLWVLHVETGRLLPYDDRRPVIGLEQKRAWYECILETGDSLASGVHGSTSDAASDGAAHGSAALDAALTEDVLPRLYSLIESRKRELPEGSYTTYLFTEGIEKIKKKTGEEAIEVLLAASHGDRLHEAADLIYHLLVLLVETGVGFDELLSELQSR